jgi:hypothetical protein
MRRLGFAGISLDIGLAVLAEVAKHKMQIVIGRGNKGEDISTSNATHTACNFIPRRDSRLQTGSAACPVALNAAPA